MNIVDKNLIVQIALELNLPDILALCRSSKRFNLAVCESDNFWYRKIGRDYNFKPDDVRNAKKYFQIIKDNWNYWNVGLRAAAEGGHKDLAEFFIQKGAWDLDGGMYIAACGGDRDLVEYFLKKGADALNWGLNYAALGGHKDIVDFFIQQGANDWDFGLAGAIQGAHKELAEFFRQKIEESKNE